MHHHSGPSSLTFAVPPANPQEIPPQSNSQLPHFHLLNHQHHPSNLTTPIKALPSLILYTAKTLRSSEGDNMSTRKRKNDEELVALPSDESEEEEE
jgi:hypothetical protein